MEDLPPSLNTRSRSRPTLLETGVGSSPDEGATERIPTVDAANQNIDENMKPADNPIPRESETIIIKSKQVGTRHGAQRGASGSSLDTRISDRTFIEENNDRDQLFSTVTLNTSANPPIPLNAPYLHMNPGQSSKSGDEYYSLDEDDPKNEQMRRSGLTMHERRDKKLHTNTGDVAIVELAHSMRDMFQGWLAKDEKKLKWTTQRKNIPYTFEGEPYEDPRLFVAQMDEFFYEMEIVGDSERILHFRSQLKGEAERWFKQESRITNRYDDLVRQFFQEYDSNMAIRKATLDLYNTTQKYKESVSLFINRKRRLYERLRPSQNKEFIIDMVSSQLDKEIKSRMRSREYRSFEELRRIAVQIETDLQDSSTTRHTNQGSRPLREKHELREPRTRSPYRRTEPRASHDTYYQDYNPTRRGEGNYRAEPRRYQSPPQYRREERYQRQGVGSPERRRSPRQDEQRNVPRFERGNYNNSPRGTRGRGGYGGFRNRPDNNNRYLSPCRNCQERHETRECPRPSRQEPGNDDRAGLEQRQGLGPARN